MENYRRVSRRVTPDVKNAGVLSIRSISVFLFALLPVGEAAAVLEEFSPYAFTRVMHDTNIFRYSSETAQAILGDNNKDDTIGYLGAGLKSDLKLSRQHLLLDAEVERAKYDKFDDLDHTRVLVRPAWQWQVGNYWDGNLGYQYKRDLSTFTQLRLPDKDMRTEHLGFFDGGYQFHPDWRVEGTLHYTDTSFQERDRLDRDSTSGQMEVQYKNTLRTTVGVRVRYTDYDLKEDQIISGFPVSNDYTETQISGVLYWVGSGKSSLEARLGYTDQEFDELDDRDYQGSTGRLTYRWEMSAKTRFNISAWRETTSLADEVTTYVLSKGVRIEPTWAATPKISVVGRLAYINDDYKGENDIRVALGGQRRDDDTLQFRVGVKWTPRTFVSAGLAYRREERDSSVDINDFVDNQVEGSVRLQF